MVENQQYYHSLNFFIQNAQNGDQPLDPVKNNTGNVSLTIDSKNSAYKIKLNKLYDLENMLEGEIQEKIDEV